MALCPGPLTSRLRWLCRLWKQNICHSQTHPEKQLLEFIFIPTLMFPLFRLRYSTVTVHQHSPSPMSLHHIKGLSILIHGTITFGISSKTVKFRWIMSLQQKIRRMYSQKLLVRSLTIAVFKVGNEPNEPNIRVSLLVSSRTNQHFFARSPQRAERRPDAARSLGQRAARLARSARSWDIW